MRAMLAPTRLLAGRYRFSKPIQTGAKTVSWLATDTETQKPVVASALGAPRVAGLEGLVGFRHAHLAALLDIIHDPDPADIPDDGKPVRAAAIAVAEFVPGNTLHARLKAGACEAEEAVGWVHGLAEAVHEMHQFGGLHGAISPRSVIVEPRGSEVAPVLTQLLAAPNGPYCAPERLRGGGPEASDDVWAIHALLYAALTGAAPFAGTTREDLVASMERGPKALAQLRQEDELLAGILERGLAPVPARRTRDAAALRDALDEWQRSGRASQISVPDLDENERAASDTQTEWDDEDAKTTVTTTAALMEMLNASASLPAPPPARAAVRPRGPLPPVPLPPPSMPPPPSMAPEPVPPDEEAETPLAAYGEEDDGPTRVIAGADMALLQPPAAPRPAPGFPPPASAPDPRPLEAPAPPSSGENLEPASVTAEPAPAGRSRAGAVVVTLALVGGAAAAAVYLARQREPRALPPPVVAVPGASSQESAGTASAAPEPSASEAPAAAANEAPAAPASASAAPPPASGGAPGNLAACVASFFPPNTFVDGQDFEFLCKDSDFRGINSQLYRRIVVAGAGKVTPGMREWSGLGWFEMATTAVVRAGCCPAGVAKPNLPTASGACPQIPDVLEKLPSLVHPDTVHAAAESYSDAVTCMYTHGVPRPYSYGKQPTGSNEYLFEQFLKRAVARK